MYWFSYLSVIIQKLKHTTDTYKQSVNTIDYGDMTQSSDVTIFYGILETR